MNLPEEIRNKEFSTALRGYKIQEVEDYIELLLEKYDQLYDENTALTEKLTLLAAEREEARQKPQEPDPSSVSAKAEAEARARAAEILARAKEQAEKELRLAEDAIKEKLRKARENAESEKRAVSEDLAGREAALAALKEEYAALLSSCEELRAERDTVRAQKALLAGETETLRGEKAGLEAARDALLTELSLFRSRLGEYALRLDELLPEAAAPVTESEPEPEEGPEGEPEPVSVPEPAPEEAPDPEPAEEESLFGSLSRELRREGEPEGTREITFDFGRPAETIPPVRVPGEDAAPQKKNAAELFSAGLKVTREPVGQASRERSFDDVKARLEKAMPDAAEQQVKPEKYI